MIVDAFGRTLNYLRVSVTDKCNLRCAYCMPAEGVSLVPHAEVLTFEEIERLVRIFARLGVRKVRITGGEPLVRRGIVDLVSRIVRVPGVESVPMTTNGLLLPQYARPLRDAGLSCLNVSLDTLREDRFLAIARHPGVREVLAGLQAAREAGFDRIKINAVLIRGFNDDETLDFIGLADTWDAGVRFIEYMPFPGTAWDAAKFMPAAEAIERIRGKFNLIPEEGRNSSDPASVFRVTGRRGSIGFIASVSESFCASCSRLRLTAEGKLVPCLHSDAFVDLRGPLRKGASDDDLSAIVQEGARLKPQAHEDFLSGFSPEAARKRKMVSIGG